MERLPSSSSTTGASSSAVQLRRLCRRILGSSVKDEVLSSKFRYALNLLSSTSPAGQLETNDDEVVVVEKIKKFLVRDGRDTDVPVFVELHQRLQQSSIIKNRLSLLQFLHALSEKKAPGLPKRRAPFPNGSLQFHSSENGTNGDTLHGGAHLAKVIPVPYRSHGQVNGASPAVTPTKADGIYHPPLPPKPHQLQSGKVAEKTPVPESLERELVRELILVFQGIEGVIIRKDPKLGSGDNYEDLAYGFTIQKSYRERLTLSTCTLTLRLAELGWMFNVVHQFCETKITEKEIGLVCQSFVTALKEELTQFYQLLTHLENEFIKGGRQMSLHQLSIFTLEPTTRLKLLATMVKSCGKLRGGALISGIYGFLHHGDPLMATTVHQILTKVTKPIYVMILRWILDGSLEDPYSEFFIASDNKVQDESRLWHDKYSIRLTMIPKFLALSWVKKILTIGKSINFLHSVCKNTMPIHGKDSIKSALHNETSPANLFSDPIENKFLEILDRCYRETSSLLLDIFFQKYKFVEHVTAMRKYLLLGQGDLIRYLLELLDEELRKPATQLYPHNLAGILETAIRATNTQYEDPDILERLDVRLLDVQPGDTGWDVFTLDYKVQGPIGTVFSDRAMLHYLMLFNSLWRSKRMEWLLSTVWTRQTGLQKMMMRSLPELKPVLHLSNLLASEMVHFVHQFAYYTTFEVMECSWDQLIRQLKEAENLDEVIQAHDEFLETLVKRALLDERSQSILDQLRTIYDRILEFSNVQNKLYSLAAAESESRSNFELEKLARERRREYGVTEEEEASENSRRIEFETKTSPQLDRQLKIIWQSFQDNVKTFLRLLNDRQDQSLLFLSFRLDFNEHYKTASI